MKLQNGNIFAELSAEQIKNIKLDDSHTPPEHSIQNY